MGNPGDGRDPSRERDMDSIGRSKRRKSRGAGRGWTGEGAQGAKWWRGVEQRELWDGPFTTPPDRENKLSQTNRGVGGVCIGVVPRV